MSAVSSLGPQSSTIGAGALRPAASGDVAGRPWFQEWAGDGPSSVLRADVEAQAKGLSADQHAERVLTCLIEGR